MSCSPSTDSVSTSLAFGSLGLHLSVPENLVRCSGVIQHREGAWTTKAFLLGKFAYLSGGSQELSRALGKTDLNSMLMALSEVSAL